MSLRGPRVGLYLFASILFANVSLHAQDAAGAIEGIVADSSGGTIASHIAIKSLESGVLRETQSGSDGLFRLPGLAVGAYVVTVRKVSGLAARK